MKKISKSYIIILTISLILVSIATLFFNAAYYQSKNVFNINHLLMPLNEVPKSISNRIDQIHPNTKKYYYRINFRSPNSPEDFINMAGRLLGKDVTIHRKYATLLKNLGGFYYSAEIYNKNKSKRIGFLKVTYNFGSITGILKLEEKTYQIYSLEYWIFALAEIEEKNYVCDHLPAKTKKYLYDLQGKNHKNKQAIKRLKKAFKSRTIKENKILNRGQLRRIRF